MSAFSLKHEKKTVISVNCNDLDTFISAVYDRPFEFVPDQEANNYSSYDFTIVAVKLDVYEQKKLDEFTSTGKGQYLTHTPYWRIFVIKV